MAKAFSPARAARLEEIARRYPRREAALLPALRLAEEEWGEIDAEAIHAVAGAVGVPPAKVHGVFTFYTHYRRPGTGRFLVQVCGTLPCALRGSLETKERLCRALGVREGETSADGRFTVRTVECLAACDRGPFVQVNDTDAGHVTPEKAERLAADLKAGRPPAHERASVDPPAGERNALLLRRVAKEGSASLASYLADGGYAGARKALAMAPEAIIEEVKRSSLRGRGGAGFPTGQKWSFVPKASPKPKYLCANADESEPGTFKDRVIIERDPHALLEGILIASRAIGARTAYVYIRGEFVEGARILERAIGEARAANWLGRDVQGSGTDLDVWVHRGAGAYICGEETGLLSSLEGDRGYPKIKPPFPAIEGLFRCPTVVQNVETLACLPPILDRGADWFRRIGPEKSPGTKVFCVSGHVARPGLYELPMGTSLKAIVYEHAGGIPGGRTLKAVIPGGSSFPVLKADQVDVAMDFESVRAAGSMLGSAGVIVMDDRTCMVRALENILRFYHHESCGQCTPCREGTGWMEKLLSRIERGAGRPEDLPLLLDICRNMVGKTICVLADAAAMPAESFVKQFRDEFDFHIREKRCLPGTEHGLPVPAPHEPVGASPRF